MKTAIVIGSGAGGAMAAKELAGHFRLTILEEGAEFKPFGFNADRLAGFRKTGLYLDERMITALFPAMRVQKSSSKMILVHGRCTGGTTTLATGSAKRCDEGLVKLGINLDEEFEELSREIPLSTEHQKYWNDTTKALFEACRQLGFDPAVTAKLIDFDRCVQCGHCVLGCPTGAKWDSRSLLEKSISAGATLTTNCRVTGLGIDHSDGTVHTVYAKENGKKTAYSADLVILAAGGLGTPVILENSGISCETTLFVDPVLCVAAEYKGAGQDKFISMPFLMQREGYMLSPYIDYLSYFFNKSWRIPSGDLLSMMIKLSDSGFGASREKKPEKDLTTTDKERLKAGVADCKAILAKMGVDEKDMFLGTLNAGHPGGMLPLTTEEAESFHNPRLPENLYIADATILPESMGNPPIWTIMAVAKRVAKICMGM
ncbi:MAG: GMC family oxidoreductase N-terminal domain-containing protein [Clostridiales bacterium]|nr:GMC family oxidoreductase N-terminal domain-containing protein [Clostridiales bacterium]